MEKDKIIIDATGAVFGRLCSFAAKKALEGNEVVIINSEKVFITGDRKGIVEKYMRLRKKGAYSQKGPKYTKIPYHMLKRGIRGMLPDHRMGMGKQAYSRVRCYDGMPDEFKNQKAIKMPGQNNIRGITLNELAKAL